MAQEMFAKVVAPKETFAALITHLRLKSWMDDGVTGQVFVALEGLGADVAAVRPIFTVTQLVSVQVFFTLQSGTTHVADEPPLYLVCGEMWL